MSANDVDDYIAALDPQRQETLNQLRADILSVIPDAEQGISYGCPVFTVGGKNVAGFSSAKDHLSYLPHSGTVLMDMDPRALRSYSWSKGALQFAPHERLPILLVTLLVRARLAEINGD